MASISHTYPVPKTILLATDLSGRCDRALDRAALLAAEWKSRLVVVHALEPTFQSILAADADVPSWRRETGRRAAIAARQIHNDLAGRDMPFDLVIEDGEPADVVQKAAAERGVDLIVTGTARSETFGRFVLGTTVERLVRRARVPVLVVKLRARKPYEKVVVATDFSAASRWALNGAAALFPQAALVVLHAYLAIGGALSTGAAGDEAGRALASRECARFLAEASLPPTSRAKLQILIEKGHVEAIVQAYAQDKGLDLLTIGAQGRSAVLDLLLGSTAGKLLASAPCDVLVMRDA